MTNTTNTWRVSAPRPGAMAGTEIYNGTDFVCQMSHHPAKRREAADTAARIVATMNRAETHAAQLADLRRALRAYDLAGPLTETRRQALGEILTLARLLTEE